MTRTRYIPQGATEIKHPKGLGVVYAYTVRSKLAAIGYIGKASKAAWHYSFTGKDPEAERERKIQQFFFNLEAHARRVEAMRAERRKPHSFQVGDIVRNTWGYEQTNVDFYEVVRISPSSVWLRPLQQETTETSFMAGTTVPLPGQYRGEAVMHRANAAGISFPHGCGRKWDGKPQHCSWYA